MYLVFNVVTSIYWQSSGLKLPSSVLPSEYEKPVGLLNEAVPVRGKYWINWWYLKINLSKET